MRPFTGSASANRVIEQSSAVGATATLAGLRGPRPVVRPWCLLYRHPQGAPSDHERDEYKDQIGYCEADNPTGSLAGMDQLSEVFFMLGAEPFKDAFQFRAERGELRFRGDAEAGNVIYGPLAAGFHFLEGMKESAPYLRSHLTVERLDECSHLCRRFVMTELMCHAVAGNLTLQCQESRGNAVGNALRARVDPRAQLICRRPRRSVMLIETIFEKNPQI